MASVQTIFTIQALRAFAAIAVVVYHINYMLVHNAGYELSISSLGGNGVDLFFIISGFIMMHTNSTVFEKKGAASAFIQRRVIRIAPTYWFYTTIVVILLAFLPKLFSTTEFNLTNVVMSYFFLLSKNTAGTIGTVLQTGWTLCFEVYFYLLFALLICFPKKYFLLSLGTIFSLGIMFGTITNALPEFMHVTTNPILFEFYIGIVIAIFYSRNVKISPYVAVVCMISGLVGLVLFEKTDIGLFSRLVFSGIPCGLFFIGCCAFEKMNIAIPKSLIALGDSSYSLYLIHPFILPFFGKIWAKFYLTESFPPIVLGVISLISALVIGHVSYLMIEKPITNFLTKSLRAKGALVLRNVS